MNETRRVPRTVVYVAYRRILTNTAGLSRYFDMKASKLNNMAGGADFAAAK